MQSRLPKASVPTRGVESHTVNPVRVADEGLAQGVRGW
jgi:hypothetical protein